MNSQLLMLLAVVAAVIVVAVMARGGTEGGPDAGSTSVEDLISEGAMPGRESLEHDDDPLAEFADEEDAEVVAITSDNYALVPDKHSVRLMPPDESGEAWKPGASHHRGARAMTASLHAGDFTGARIVRGEADEAPWRLEAMGRDGDYTAFLFETRGGADAALALFESRGVVRTGKDEDGNPSRPSAEQFEEARRIFLETEAELTAEFPEDRP